MRDPRLNSGLEHGGDRWGAVFLAAAGGELRAVADGHDDGQNTNTDFTDNTRTDNKTKKEKKKKRKKEKKKKRKKHKNKKTKKQKNKKTKKKKRKKEKKDKAKKDKAKHRNDGHDEHACTTTIKNFLKLARAINL
jgi:hypothetical protein